MRAVRYAVADRFPAPIERVFAIFAEPSRLPEWLPGCQAATSEGPLRAGGYIEAHFNQRVTEFEVTEFAPPHAFGWRERGARKGSRLVVRLGQAEEFTTIGLRATWTPPSGKAWVRGHLLERRAVEDQLKTILANLRRILTV